MLYYQGQREVHIMRDEISLLQAQLAYKKKLVAVLKELYDQQLPLEKKVAQLEKIMLTQQKELQRLEGHSLSAFFYYALGKIDEKLDEERRGAYAARVKYDAARRELEAIRQDIEATKEDLEDLADCETRYAQVLEEKRKAIEANGTPISAELVEKERQLTFLQNQERELEEAISAGTMALRIANDVAASLRNAENLGAFDLLGSGFLAGVAKHETVDEAQKNVEELQVYLQRFNKELADVELRPQLQVSLEELLKFSDLMLEGLLTDEAILEKIRHALRQVDHTRDQILGILRQLQTRLEEVRHNQIRAKDAVDALIVNA